MPHAPTRPTIPAWLAHPLRWPRIPVPWVATLRGAAGAGPLLAAGVASGHPALGVLAALGALMAGANDGRGTRRLGVLRLGGPALGGALGLLLGGLLADAGAGGGGGASSGGSADGWWLVPALAAVGLVSGTISAIGPVASATGTQLLVTSLVGAGMPLPGAAWFKALAFLAGASWITGLRTLPRWPRRRHALHPCRALDGERQVVAAAYNAIADLIASAGRPGGRSARRQLTEAMDNAHDALHIRRLPWRRPSAAERRVRAQMAATSALCEASVTLLWEGAALPDRASHGPRRLAEATRTGRPCGRLPAPAPGTAGQRALDSGLLDAAIVFDSAHSGGGGSNNNNGGLPEDIELPHGWQGRAWRRALDPAGWEYGARVAVCTGASVAIAMLLHQHYWFWLPVTAAFLVKPDLGPLFSRAVSRFVGTAAGVLLFAGLASQLTGAWWPVLVAGSCGALMPVATRHFALQTAVVTVLVLSVALLGGDPTAAWPRLVDTLLGCAIVVVAGHLPLLRATPSRVALRVAAAVSCSSAYLDHVLRADPGPDMITGTPDERFRLRRAAYRALAEARRAVEPAAAELPPVGAQAARWAPVVTAVERIVDATTACAVRLDHGALRPSQRTAAELTGALAVLAAAIATRRPPDELAGAAPAAPDGCATLADVALELRELTAPRAAA